MTFMVSLKILNDHGVLSPSLVTMCVSNQELCSMIFIIDKQSLTAIIRFCRNRILYTCISWLTTYGVLIFGVLMASDDSYIVPQRKQLKETRYTQVLKQGSCHTIIHHIGGNIFISYGF